MPASRQSCVKAWVRPPMSARTRISRSRSCSRGSRAVEEPEAALVGAGGTLLLGVGGEEAGVDIEDQLLGPGAGVPGLGQRLRPGGAERFQGQRVDGLDHPVGRRLRRHRPEQRLLAAQHTEVRDVIAAVGDRDREVAQDDAGVVRGAAHSGQRHRLGERSGEAEPVGQLDQQVGAGVGDEPLAVRPDFYGLRCRLCLHLPGVLLGLWEWARKPHSQEPRGRSRMVWSATPGQRLPLGP